MAPFLKERSLARSNQACANTLKTWSKCTSRYLLPSQSAISYPWFQASLGRSEHVILDNKALHLHLINIHLWFLHVLMLPASFPNLKGMNSGKREPENMFRATCAENPRVSNTQSMKSMMWVGRHGFWMEMVLGPKIPMGWGTTWKGPEPDPKAQSLVQVGLAEGAID